MLSESQKSSLKKELTEIKAHLMTTKNESDIKDSAQEDSGELSMYANHPGDLGTVLYDREKNMAINVHANAELEKVEGALKGLQEGSYGKCEECGINIPFERLEAIPYTTVCMKHAVVPDALKDRPVEENVLKPAFNNSFAKGQDGDIRDYQDSFKEAAQDGTSETPSDFTGDHDDYETLYENKVSKGITEDYESFTVTDISGQGVHVVESPESEEYKETLDELGIESPIGDIPYHQKDSYLKK